MQYIFSTIAGVHPSTESRRVCMIHPILLHSPCWQMCVSVLLLPPSLFFQVATLCNMHWSLLCWPKWKGQSCSTWTTSDALGCWTFATGPLHQPPPPCLLPGATAAAGRSQSCPISRTSSAQGCLDNLSLSNLKDKWCTRTLLPLSWGFLSFQLLDVSQDHCTLTCTAWVVVV
jgi:hypothetical protein